MITGTEKMKIPAFTKFVAVQYIFIIIAVSVSPSPAYCIQDPIHVLPNVSLSKLPPEYEFIYRQQDLFHRYFIIYDEINSGGNHFCPSGWMGDLEESANTADKKIFDPGYPHEEKSQDGATAIKITYPREVAENGKLGWGGIYWLSPCKNWGKEAGMDLSTYKFPFENIKLEFWAKGKTGREYITFRSGGINRPPYYKSEFPYQDSFGPLDTYVFFCDGLVRLGTGWKHYEIDLSSADLRSVIGPFCWVLESDLNPQGATFYLDNIRIVFGHEGTNKRLAEPRFIRSFVPAGSEGPDLLFHNEAYSYDNALAILAFVARQTSEDIRRAGLVADAFVYAQKHDPEFSDGRIRNAYSSGDLSDNVTSGKIRLPGWQENNRWYQDEYAMGSDCGNMAWTVIALLSYWEKIGRPLPSVYLDAAIKMGKWIFQNGYSEYGRGGYTGGISVKCTNEMDCVFHKANWKSTEHNLDIYVAFSRLADADKANASQWSARATHAKEFVEHMWNDRDGHFWTGTIMKENQEEINKTPVPLDVQAWAVLAMPDEDQYYEALNWAVKNCCAPAFKQDSFCNGFEFKCGQVGQDDPQGAWWEGTGQMTVAFRMLGRDKDADSCLDAFERHVFSVASDGGGVPACSTSECFTGFFENGLYGAQRKYLKREHLGATCWYIFGKLGWNPYWGKFTGM